MTYSRVNDGVVISNDKFRDIANEYAKYLRIGFTFHGDLFVLPCDPYGKGSSLDKILTKKNPSSKLPSKNKPLRFNSNFFTFLIF